MPRLISAVPKYCHHKASGQAVVTLDAHDYYLGPHKSKTSLLEYDRLVALWQANGRRMPGSDEADLTVNELAIAYLKFAAGYYVKGGRPTSEIDSIRAALRPLVKAWGERPVGDFGPLALKAVRAEMVALNWCRKSINKHVGRVRRMFSWGVEEELVGGEVTHALAEVKGLKRGRSDAAESSPVKPVPDAYVEAILPHVSRQVAGMIRLQCLTGMRPESVVEVRGCDLDTTGSVWECRPASHKTQHFNIDLVIYLGPQAQQTLRPFLRPDLQSPLFSPAEARAEQNARRREERRSPITPSQAARRPKNNPGRPPGNKYSVDSYRRCIERACLLAGVPKWTPGRLRHNAATRLRKEFGLEAAQTVLGHTNVETT